MFQEVQTMLNQGIVCVCVRHVGLFVQTQRKKKNVKHKKENKQTNTNQHKPNHTPLTNGLHP